MFTIPNVADAAFPHQSRVFSTDFATLVAGDAATGVVSGGAVTAQGTPDMTVAVAAGTVSVAGVDVTVAGGNVTITAADSSNARFDLIVSDNVGALSAVAGSPIIDPVLPAIPANSVVLATVYVPANDTAINSNQIIDKRVFVTNYARLGAINTFTKRQVLDPSGFDLPTAGTDAHGPWTVQTGDQFEGQHDHPLMFLFNVRFDQASGLWNRPTANGSHSIRHAFESRFVSDGDYTNKRGQYEWNIDLDLQTTSHATMNLSGADARRPWFFIYDMDVRKTNLYIGSSVDTGNVVTIYGTDSRISLHGDIVLYRDTSNGAHFSVNGADRWAITSAGQIGIGMTPVSTYRLAVQSSTATDTVFVVRGAASQSGDLVQWQTSGGGLMGSVGSAGSFFAQGPFYLGQLSYLTSRVQVFPSSATERGIVVKGFASQTANLQEWQDSTGTVLASIAFSGRGQFFQLNDLSNTGTYLTFSTTTASIIGRIAGSTVLSVQAAASQSAAIFSVLNSASATLLQVDSTGYLLAVMGASVKPRVVGQVGLIVQGLASQTADLQEWQNSSGAVLAKVASDGSFTVGDVAGTNYISLLYAEGSLSRMYGSDTSYLFRNTTNTPNIIYTPRAAALGLVIRGFASQTATLTEWRNSADAALAAVQANGTAAFGGLSAGGGASYDVIGAGRQAYIGIGSTTRVGLVVQGTASQTADLQQWQNSAAGLLASIGNTGAFFTAGPMYVGTLTYLTAALNLFVRSTTEHGLIIKGVASQTSDYFRIQDSSNVILASMNSSGQIGIGITPTKILEVGGETWITIASANTSSSGLVVAKRGTTGDATAAVASGAEIGYHGFYGWNGSGYARGAYVIAKSTQAFTGSVNGMSYGLFVTPNGSGSGGEVQRLLVDTNGATVFAGAAAAIGWIVKGAASQTGDLQQWQNSSATVLAKVTSTGIGDFASLKVAGTDIASTYVANALVDAKGDLIAASADNTPVRVAVGTNDRVLVADSAQAPGIKWGSFQTKYVVKGSDENVNNSAVFQDDDALTFAIGTTETIEFEFRIYAVSASVNSDIKFTVTGPASIGGYFAAEARWGTADAFAVNLANTVGGSGAISFGLDTTIRAVVIRGIAVGGGTAGNITLQWAQNAATVENVTIKTNSYAKYTKIS